MPAAVVSLPLPRRRRVSAILVAVLVAVLVAALVATTLVVLVATAVAAVTSASWTPWLKSTPVLAAGARMGGSQSDLELLRDKNTTIRVFPRPMCRDKIVDSRHFNAWGEKGGEIWPKRR